MEGKTEFVEKRVETSGFISSWDIELSEKLGLKFMYLTNTGNKCVLEKGVCFDMESIEI